MCHFPASSTPGEATGNFGVRVRRGLGTRDQAEAERLRVELDELLAHAKFRDPAARAEAARRFDERVVDIFFDKMIPDSTDFRALHDAERERPSSCIHRKSASGALSIQRN